MDSTEEVPDLSPSPVCSMRPKFNIAEYEARKKTKCYLPKFEEPENLDDYLKDSEDEKESSKEPSIAEDQPPECVEKKLEYREKSCWLADNQKMVLDNILVLNDERKNAAQNKLTFANLHGTMEEAHMYNQENLRKRVRGLSSLKKNTIIIVERMTESIRRLESQRGRLKRAILVYNQCSSISKSCIEIRSQTPPSELILDDTEKSLREEERILAEKIELFTQTIKEVEELVRENRKMKVSLEMHFSEGTQNLEATMPKFIESFKCGPHIVHLDDVDAPLELVDVEAEILAPIQEGYDKSTDLHKQNMNMIKKIDSMLLNSAAEIRALADETDKYLRDYICCLKENIISFDRDLVELLKNIVKTDERLYSTATRIPELKAAWATASQKEKKEEDDENYMEKKDEEKKINEDECEPLKELLNENANPSSTIGVALSELSAVEKLKKSLIKTRYKLEFQLLCKRKALWLNSERVVKQRVKFPCGVALNIKMTE